MLATRMNLAAEQNAERLSELVFVRNNLTFDRPTRKNKQNNMLSQLSDELKQQSMALKGLMAEQLA
jgi:hypothetical protein